MLSMHGWVIRTIAHVKPCERILKRCQRNLANGEPERQYRAKLQIGEGVETNKSTR